MLSSSSAVNEDSGLEADDHLSARNKRRPGSVGWQQKQVSIKTLEGEFSVTMWASGADEGENVYTAIEEFCLLLCMYEINYKTT